MPCFELAKGSSVLSEDAAAVILSAEMLYKAPARAHGNQTKEKREKKVNEEKTSIMAQQSNKTKSPDWISSTSVWTSFSKRVTEQ